MQNIQELVTKGKLAFENKEYAAAETLLKQVASRGVEYADVFNILGVIAHAEGKFQQAIEHFEKALKRNPHYTEALLNLAVLYNDLGKYADAKKLYAKLRKGKETEPRQIEPVLQGKLSNLHADIGDIYRNIGLYSHAVQEYQKALQHNPSYADIRLKLGMALRDAGELATAITELKSVIRQEPKYTDAHVQLGITYYAMGKAADAKKAWQQALKLAPTHAHAEMYLRLSGAEA
jgi:tetratricopeptide (TPR) repeat protein